MKANRRANLLYWLIAMGLCTLCWGAIALWGDLRYFTNDDVAILRAFMGYPTGTPPTFHLYIHALLAYPLYWLGTAFPGVAWFSFLQIALLWLAGVVTVKSLMQAAANRGLPLWTGAAAGALYLAVYSAAYWTRVTFTVTAALLGAAAVAQILSVNYQTASNGKIIASLLLSLLLTALAYALRQVSVLPILAFCALALAGVYALYFAKGRRSPKPLLISVLIMAVVMGGLCAQRTWDIREHNSEDFLAWQDATARVMDYTGMDHVTDETLARIGWTREEYKLVTGWYFLDENITTDAFDAIYAEELPYLDQSVAAKTAKAFQTLGMLGTLDGLAARSFGLSALIFLSGFILLLLKPKGRGRLALWLLAGLLLCLAMLFYLAYQGRLPIRAALTPILPATVFALMLVPQCLPHAPSFPARTALAVCCLGWLALGLWYAIPAAADCARPAYDPEREAERSLSADLDEYALDNPDYLIIHDFSLVMDSRMFPDTSNGIPHNVMFWGGWVLRSPESLQQMAAFGIDGTRFTPEDFLREDVCLASGVLDPPAKDVLAYLNAALGDVVDVNYEGNNGNVHIFQFYRTDE